VPVRYLLPLTLAIVVGIAAGPAQAAPKQGKEYALDVAPLTEYGGVTDGAYTVTITNNTGTQQVGSANVTVPSAIAITNRNGIPGTGQILELRNLALPAGASVTVTIGVRMPCVAGDYLWLVEAKQSNDFSGPPGNALGPVSGNRTTTVQGQCVLNFVDQPASAVEGAQIRADAFQPNGTHFVSVEALDARPSGAQRTASFNGSITLTSSPSGLLATSSTAVAGFATFPNLIIGASNNYTLKAAASGLVGDESTPFQIVDIAATCAPGPGNCNTGNLNGANNGAKSSAVLMGAPTAGSGFALLTLGLGRDPLTSDGCRGLYMPPGDDFYEFQLFGFGLNSAGQKTVVMSYTKQAMKGRGPSSLEVCLAVPGPTGFTAKNGAPAPSFVYDGDPSNGVAGFAGLVPDCGSSPTEPCVLDRSPTGSGGASITLFDPTLGDPRMH
jgi:hypothetical protein